MTHPLPAAEILTAPTQRNRLDAGRVLTATDAQLQLGMQLDGVTHLMLAVAVVGCLAGTSSDVA